MFASKDTLLTRPSGGYTIARSVRLRSSATAYFNRTLTTPTGAGIWTFSAWVKRGLLDSTDRTLVTAGSALSNFGDIYFQGSTSKIIITFYQTSLKLNASTSAVFRDPSAWYHIIVAVDMSQATSTNGCKIWINGVQQTLTISTYVQGSGNSPINSALGHSIGSDQPYASSGYFDGYLTEINFVDGQQLTASSFGETDSITGVWKPKAYSGTYGTNGFELNFSDNSNNTAATIGKDYSGNGNNWTPNNISVTAGATYDSMVDSPTVGATSSNYAVLNPLAMYGTNAVISNANLTSSATGGANDRGWPSTIAAPSSGKWYAEFTFTATDAGNNGGCGIMLENGTGAPGESATTVSWRDAGTLRQNASGTSYGTALSVNDVVMVAYDASLGRVWFGKQGTWFASGDPATNANPSATGITTSGRFATYHYGIAATIAANFGQRPFSYTPPTGFVALNTYNLPASTIKNGASYMAATTYTGNGSTQSISNAVNGVSFQPDLVWIKGRSYVSSNWLTDSIRGVNNILSSNQTAAEVTVSSTMTAFNSNGFSVGSNADFNSNTNTLVGWQWKAGTTSASNTNGSITSTVSVGATQGFSVVTYTGTGANATVGHGLGVAPQMIIIKGRDTGYDWRTYHASVGNTSALFLNTTSGSVASSTYWNNTSPTSSVFSVGSNAGMNGSTNTYVAYCFAAVAGYSAFGSYTGNGSTDGPFVFTNFRPRFVMTKRTDSTSDWVIMDSSRNTYNPEDKLLYPNLSNAEDTLAIEDFLSNGFKFRNASTTVNASGGTYIYMAFAEVGFKSALAR